MIRFSSPPRTRITNSTREKCVLCFSHTSRPNSKLFDHLSYTPSSTNFGALPMADIHSPSREKRKKPGKPQASETSDSDNDRPTPKRARISDGPHQDSVPGPAERNKYDPDHVRVPKPRGKVREDLEAGSAQQQKNERRCVNCWRFGRSHNGFHPFRQCTKNDRKKKDP